MKFYHSGSNNVYNSDLSISELGQETSNSIISEFVYIARKYLQSYLNGDDWCIFVKLDSCI